MESPSAVDSLKENQSAIDVIQSGITPVESDSAVSYVGFGGAPNMFGEVECDASIIDGSTRNVGTVAGLKGYVEAFWVARKVMEDSPHVSIGGKGAAMFAAEMGAVPQEMLSDKAREEYLQWKSQYVPANVDLSDLHAPRNEIVRASSGLDHKKDTVVFLVLDAAKNIAAGGSTTGWAYKYPGRYGDTPLPGAGLWADNEGGACGCTHTGEMTGRALTAKFVVDAMRRGAGVQDSVHDAINELRRLKGGYQGQVVIHAISKTGEYYVATTQEESELVYWVWNNDSQAIESLEPIVEKL